MTQASTGRQLDGWISPSDQARVVAAIRDAEARCSGEVRVHLEATCKGVALARARELFVPLGLHRTRERNGVLIYVAVEDRRLAVWGDEGIDKAAGAEFWRAAVDRIRAHFSTGALADGLVAGISVVGELLAERFPPRADDVNELPDQISTD